ncbi:uncharacterized protein LOC119335573 [Triticum dicoccoides]|uniref:uncharacterized protein LOC119335573 n=1 Tax=Triticum dicoccoides TaxID=85692 RepID=UPI0018918713|nr:uncharacterized protein LOC119335573 [Triticum dicoccoides]
MAPPPPPPPLKNPSLSTRHLILLLLLSTATFSAAVSTRSYSSICPTPAPAPDRHTDADDALSLARSFQIYDGYFSGGEGSLFSPDDHLHGSYRSFSLFPDRAVRTTDPALLHLTATLTLAGPRFGEYHRSHGNRGNYTIPAYISFVLDGYYSSASLQLCMVGTGTEPAADGSVKQYADVALHLRVPSPPSLADPFVDGSLDGSSGFGAIQLLAYAEGDDYEYGERPTCSPPVRPARGSPQELDGGSFVCDDLKERLVTSYRLQDQHGGSPAKLPRMHVNRMKCTPDGAVRAYVVFSNDTGDEGRRLEFLVDEEAVVADGHWDSARDMLCLRACRVSRSVPTPSTLAVRECGIELSFWLPAEWTILERSVVAGALRNPAHGRTDVMSAFSIHDRRRNLSDVRYSYNDTMLDVAKKHYLKINKEKIRGSFPVPSNSAYHDFRLHFFVANRGRRGEAYPVAIGSVIVNEDGLSADDSLPGSAVGDTEHDLLRISYDLHCDAAADNWVRPTKNMSYSYRPEEERRISISAEGVYDPKRGILSMAGCQRRNGSTDCQILVTVQFASLDLEGLGGGGAISSLRDRSDRLFFETMNITLYGMYTEQLSEAVSRMDMESIMLVASTMLSCIFAALQILHAKKNPEAAAATSITMLAVLALGHLAPLVLSFEVIFMSRRSQYFLDSTSGWLELNQVMMSVPALVAFVLHLRLLHLALAGRLRPAAGQSEPATTSVSERAVLKVCLPLYLLGGVMAAAVHAINIRTSREGHIGGEAAMPWDDVVWYAGLMLDGFLLPQVILNESLSGSKVRAISRWFYMGGTLIRVAPHVYDVVRRRVYVPSMSPSDIYASPRGDLFGVAWDVVILCGAALLASLLFFQQRLGAGASLPWQRKRSGGYEMVSRI